MSPSDLHGCETTLLDHITLFVYAERSETKGVSCRAHIKLTPYFCFSKDCLSAKVISRTSCWLVTVNVRWMTNDSADRLRHRCFPMESWEITWGGRMAVDRRRNANASCAATNPHQRVQPWIVFEILRHPALKQFIPQWKVMNLRVEL